MTLNDGGPAFPNITDEMPIQGSPGMSLRDYFAAKVLCAVIVHWGTIARSDAADWAYGYADSMLAERSKKS